MPPGAREIVGDRQRLTESADNLRALAPDVVIDVVLSSGRQARELMTVFGGHARRVVALSSMDVYRACGVTHRLEDGPLEPLPLREETSALRTKLQTYPPAQVQVLQQIFGWLDDEYDKIPIEREVLGHGELPGTVVRLPMVYGPRDPLHRFHPIVKRIVDGRRAIPFSADMAQWRATKGYVEDVGAAIVAAAVADRATGRIYNVGEADTLTELEWAQQVARALNWVGEFKLMPDDRLPAHLRAPGNTAQHWIARHDADSRGARLPRNDYPRGSDSSNSRVGASQPAHRFHAAPVRLPLRRRGVEERELSRLRPRMRLNRSYVWTAPTAR